MKKILVIVLAMMMSFAFLIGEADAKRFGGGRSVGQQRSMTPQQAAPRPAAAPAPAAPAPASGASRWLGPLAGLAVGGLLASMFMGHGFEGIKPMDILLFLGIAAAIFFIFRAMRKNQSAAQPMQYAGNTGPVVTPVEQSYTGGGGAAQPVAAAWPSWFEAEPFVRAAKSHFIRLQAAYDDKDLKDIRNYTTPEMYAEISLQVQEMGPAKQQTEVVTLNAEVLNVVVEGDTAIASVRFSGLIREEADGKAEPFNEIWHVQKTPAQSNEGWLVAGIQQA